MDVDTALKSAADWQTKKHPIKEANARRAAIVSMAHQAVRMNETEGLAWLSKRGAGEELERVAAIGRLHSTDGDLFEVDLANVLGLFDVSRLLIAGTPKQKIAVWEEYRKALEALLSSKHYDSPTLTAKGWLASFLPYLELAARLSDGKQIEPEVLSAVDNAFLKRNSSRRSLDPVGIDGDGESPVKWDLRKRSLLAAAK